MKTDNKQNLPQTCPKCSQSKIETKTFYSLQGSAKRHEKPGCFSGLVGLVGLILLIVVINLMQVIIRYGGSFSMWIYAISALVIALSFLVFLGPVLFFILHDESKLVKIEEMKCLECGHEWERIIQPDKEKPE